MTMEADAFGETLLQVDTFATLPSSCLEAVPACSSFVTMIFLWPSGQLEMPHNFLIFFAQNVRKEWNILCTKCFCIDANRQNSSSVLQDLCLDTVLCRFAEMKSNLKVRWTTTCNNQNGKYAFLPKWWRSAALDFIHLKFLDFKACHSGYRGLPVCFR